MDGGHHAWVHISLYSLSQQGCRRCAGHRGNKEGADWTVSKDVTLKSGQSVGGGAPRDVVTTNTAEVLALFLGSSCDVAFVCESSLPVNLELAYLPWLA